jgi:hypothetical protein
MSAHSTAVDAKLVGKLEDGLTCSIALDQAVKLSGTELASDAASPRRRQHAWISIFPGQRLFKEALHRWRVV